jgi:hypothetical protein
MAIAWPIPELAPVTKAILPTNPLPCMLDKTPRIKVEVTWHAGIHFIHFGAVM